MCSSVTFEGWNCNGLSWAELNWIKWDSLRVFPHKSKPANKPWKWVKKKIIINKINYKIKCWDIMLHENPFSLKLFPLCATVTAYHNFFCSAYFSSTISIKIDYILSLFRMGSHVSNRCKARTYMEMQMCVKKVDQYKLHWLNL